MTPRVHAENLIWELLAAYGNKNSYQTKQMDDEFLRLKNEIIDCIVRPLTLAGQIAAIYGDLDAEDVCRIDREWARMRGYILPEGGASTLTPAICEASENKGGGAS